jgi:hypothetical protein
VIGHHVVAEKSMNDVKDISIPALDPGSAGVTDALSGEIVAGTERVRSFVALQYFGLSEGDGKQALAVSLEPLQVASCEFSAASQRGTKPPPFA